MQWLVDLFKVHSVPQTVLLLMVVSAIGIALGHVKVKGISLGIAWVLFSGLLVSHLGFTADHHTLHFVREFGLILFVFTIGMQVGPSFFGTLKKQGLPLNVAALCIVLGAVGLSVAQWKWFMGGTKENVPAITGLLAGGTTNTPSMAAGIAAMEGLARRGMTGIESAAETIGSAYAIAYPMGIFGLLAAILLVRFIFKIDVKEELRQLASAQGNPALSVLNLEVINPSLVGRRIREVPTLDGSGIAVTRVMRSGAVEMAGPEAMLQLGDVLTAVGPQKALDQLEIVIGRRTQQDARTVASDIGVKVILVSNVKAVGRTIGELALRSKYGAVVTRILRAEFELPVTVNTRLQFGDRLTVVGESASMPAVLAELGDSPKQLDKPILAPVFLGIALGVIVGMIPIAVPGLPVPLRLGLAGGPLIVAILLSRLYRVGPLVWYMPPSANYMLREIGIVLFLACAGLLSGESFWETFKSHGATWVGIGAAITFVPVFLVALILRGVFKMNFVTMSGLLAGSMTDPPALAFAQNITGSDAPTVSYASVYPLVMLLRVMSTQGIVLMLMR